MVHMVSIIADAVGSSWAMIALLASMVQLNPVQGSRGIVAAMVFVKTADSGACRLVCDGAFQPARWLPPWRSGQDYPFLGEDGYPVHKDIVVDMLMDSTAVLLMTASLQW